MYECVLEHGDALYMPSGFWHYITYLDGGFSVSYRKMAYSLSWKLAGLLSLCVYMPFDKAMNKMLGKRWLRYKEDLAQKRANREIAGINGPSQHQNQSENEQMAESPQVMADRS